MLNKLVEISSGKWSSIAAPPKKNRNQSVKMGGVRASQSRGIGPTSLNMGVRKRETERIERENHAFAKRLFDKRAVLTKKKFDDEFNNHKKYQR